jgi:methane/ammonia monooxygenase subunit B
MAAPVASAHGEESQQAFERTSTIAFYDVKFSTDRLDRGQDLTITGTMRVMKAWPDHTIAPPDLGYLTVNIPGPVFEVQEREMSGTFTPESVNVVKGGVYPFKLVLRARTPGRWHVHPAMAMHGTGTLVGRGQYVTINDAGVFTEPQTLLNGRTVSLTTYGLSRVAIWEFLGFLLAAAYAAYLLRKPLLERADMIKRGDLETLYTKWQPRPVLIGFAVAALVLGFGGYAYAYAVDGPHVPLQVIRMAPTPEPASALATHLDTKVQSAVFDQKAGSLVLTLNVKNRSNTPVVLDHLQFADYVIDVKEGGDATQSGVATVSPPTPVAPGSSSEMKVTLDARSLVKRSLLPLNEPQVRVTGLMFFRDSAGQTSVSEVNELTSGVIPQYNT